jgi:predicted nucleic acid-binding protein
VTPEEWLDANNRYLGASLQWVRLVLKSAAGGSAAASLAKDIQAAAAARDAAAKITPAPTLSLLGQTFGLSDFEMDVLLLCAAAELDPAVPGLCADVQGSGRGYPTFGLALNAFDEAGWESLSPQRPLRQSRLIEISQPGATPLTGAALRIDERILNFLKGLNALDERVALLVTAAPDTVAEIAASQQATVDSILARLGMHDGQPEAQTVNLIGADGASKLAVAQHVCFNLNRLLYRIGMDALPTHKSELETFVRLWQRERLLLPVALFVDADDIDGGAVEAASALSWLTTRDRGLLFVALRDTPARQNAAAVTMRIGKPTPAEQFTAWQGALPQLFAGADVTDAARRLAGQFDLNLQDLSRAVAAAGLAGATGAPAAAAGGSSAPADTGARVWTECREMLRPRLDLLAQRLDAKATWPDLVLPDESLGLLRQIVSQAGKRYSVYHDWGFAERMNRGLGISALFCGESGTGKTMAAEVIANDLGLHLYRIDLSAVVSKYIGETDRNLRRLFDAAEQGGAILFFDECDALFGKRSEVKDSHDRYANIEINYLLQRMESFTGLAILATNMKSALDQAFLRRLRFIVNFQFPGAAERARIWQRALPAQIPTEGLDFERLSRFNLSGGNIHSIVLNAAFNAAQRGSPVTMQLMLSAVRAELRKLEKQINEAEFRSVEPVRAKS